MNSMSNTVLESYAYDNVYIKKNCTTTNSSCTYVCMYSDFSNHDSVAM